MKDFKPWREAGNHLPDIMKDFHDCKDLFKAVHEIIKTEEHEYCKDISWMDGMCYTVDIFLWFMARYGYTLQKSRSKVEFEDLRETLDQLRARRQEAFARMLSTYECAD